MMLRFRSNTVMPMPFSVLPGPGGTNRVLQPAEEFELAPENVDRFVRNRVRSGDFTQLPPTAPAAATRKE